jgi:hypothetical protein
MSRASRGFGRAIALAVVPALVLGVLLATPASAITRNISFDIWIGEECVGGRGTDDTTGKVTWRDSDGVIKQAGRVRTDKKGYWRYCGDWQEIVERGDTIDAWIGGVDRSVTIPRLKVAVDRASDVISGKAPAGSVVTLEGCARYSIDWANCRTTSVVADGSGDYSYDWSPLANLRGRDWVEADLLVGRDHFRRAADVPYIAVSRGSASFYGHYRPYRQLEVTLSDDGVVKDVWRGRADGSSYGWFRGRFADAQGHSEWTRAGDTISISEPGFEVDFRVPNVRATIYKGSDIVKGVCVPNRPFKVTATNRAGTRTATMAGKAGSDGRFKRDFTKKMNITSGTVIWIYCSLDSGDLVQRRRLVK